MIFYEERMVQYRKAVRDAFKFPVFIGLPTCFGFFWLFGDALPTPWWLMALISWIALMVPPIMKSLPRRPQLEDDNLVKVMYRIMKD